MTIRVFGGGTLTHVSSHFALCAPAKGKTAKLLHSRLVAAGIPATLHLTSFADSSSSLDTNDDVEAELIRVLQLPETSAVVFSVALCDFYGQVNGAKPHKYGERLQTRLAGEDGIPMVLHPTKKLLGLVRELRPDVFSVGFKTTANKPVEVQVERAIVMANQHRLDLVLANDVVTRQNLVMVGPGMSHAPATSFLYEGTSREQALSRIFEALQQNHNNGR